jgi:hypothetical protein
MLANHHTTKTGDGMQQLRSSAATADMYDMRKNGATVAQIAAEYGKSEAAIYQRLNREYGGLPARGPVAESDNKTVKMMPNNGGCSTLSGLMPVSVARSAKVSA